MIVVATLLAAAVADASYADGPATPDIMVVAEKRLEDRVDAPMSIGVVAGDALDRLRIQTLRDLSYSTPGLLIEAESPVHPYIAIRGIATEVPDVASEPRVSLFQDGVSSSRLQGAVFEIMDVERIEVAKGPQSTLFGRAALIGAVNVIDRRPDPSATAESIRGELGGFESRRLDGVLNLPLGDTAAVRLAGRYRRQDGYVDNLLGGSDFNGLRTGAIRGSLRLLPAEGLTIDLIGNYQNDLHSGVSYKSRTFAPSDRITGAVIGDRDPASGATLSAGHGFQLGDDLGGRRTLQNGTGLVDYALSNAVSIHSVTGFRRFTTRSTVDYDGTALQLLTSGERNDGNQFSQELRFDYASGDRLHGFAGAGFFHESALRRIPVQIDEREALALFLGQLDRTNPLIGSEARYTNPQFSAALLRGAVGAVGGTLSVFQALAIAANLQRDHQEEYTNRARTDAYDVFADLGYEATDRLRIQGGLRLTHDDKLLRFVSSTRERSVLAGVLGALHQPAAVRDGLLAALAAPNASFIPTSSAYPLPMFALSAQPSGGVDSRRLRSTGLSWRLNALYELRPQLNGFLSYARGRRPDVTSAVAPAAPGGDTRFSDLAAETVDDVEAGLKFRSPDDRLSLEATAFSYWYRHFQTQAFIDTQTVSTDAGKAASYGLEAEARWRPNRSVELFGSYAFNHARYRSGLYDGNRFRLSPDHSATVGVHMAASLAGIDADLTPTVSYRSRTFFDSTNGNPALLAGTLFLPIDYRPSQGGYPLMNVVAGIAGSNARWRIEAFAENLLDKHYLRDTGAGSLDFGLPTYIAAPPRRLGIALKVEG